MRRVTITTGGDLEDALEVYIRQREVAPALTALAQAALREYLARRGFVAGPKKLRITPARKGSGARDASVQHDRYLAANEGWPLSLDRFRRENDGSFRTCEKIRP
jgi:hypothetical protein